MLPSTGYFKGINCPFYDSGLCERPYCHFRHVKKELQNDTIESGAILQKLVTAAVQKVLQQTDASGVVSPTQVATDSVANADVLAISSKPTYNPTPIAELNKINSVENDNNEDKIEQLKRHIPIPYTPRKPSTLPTKRSTNENGNNVFTYIAPAKYSPGSESTELETYTPKGSTESTKKYLPGKETTIQEYIPNESLTTSKHNYVPSDKTANKSKILEYKPAKSKTKCEQKSLTYQPTPKSLVPCFSSDEEEPESKKRKLSTDLKGLDDLGPEFDILDQILDEEKMDQEVNTSVQDRNKNKQVKHLDMKSKSKDSKENKQNMDSKSNEKCHIHKDKINEKKHVREIDKKRDHRSDKESEKEVNKDKERKYKESNKSERTSSHKKKEEKRDKHEKKSHSSSKTHKNDSNRSKGSTRHDSKNHKSQDTSSKSKEKHKHVKDKIENVKNKDETNEYVYNDELNNLSESDEDAIALECKRIFEEYVPSEKNNDFAEVNNKDEAVNDSDDYVINSKKRISRTNEKNIKIVPKAPIKPDFKVNAAQAMAERLSKVKEYHAAKSCANNDKPNQTLKLDIAKSYFSASSNGNSKVRIAHVPYASTLITAKKGIPPNTNSSKNIEPSTSSTAIQTVKKGTQRVAHMPSEKFIDRPGVLEPLASKIPANIRSTYLNMMIDHCLNIYLCATDAYARAQQEELATSKKCSTVQIYKNSSVLAISRLKKEVQECKGIKKSTFESSTSNKHPTSISSNTKTLGSWSIENKNKRDFDDMQQYTGAKLYNNIFKWVLSEEQLTTNGFPRPHSSGEKGRAIIHGQNKQKPPKGFIRTCCRCKKDYTVDKKGFAAVKQECIYHPNNKYKFRGEVRYQCCSQDGFSDGCCIATSHVYEYVDFDNLKGYVKTLSPERVKDDYGVYSLDCEMCYTTHGLDLTRVTVINSACKVVYETLIKPLHPIIDYNTRYSGITEEQMAQVKTTLLDVQATLLSMFNSKTILIGHSLESDFKALKLIHDTVVDTSVLFPHKMGPPYKRALRNLSSEYLKKIIQNSVDGHDSAEDATVCMELIIYKLKEDLKTR